MGSSSGAVVTGGGVVVGAALVVVAAIVMGAAVVVGGAAVPGGCDVVVPESSLLQADNATAAATMVDTMTRTAPEHIGARVVSKRPSSGAGGSPVG